LPPSLAALQDRLSKRGQDDDVVIDARMAEARDELSHVDEFDYVVVNEVFDVALEALRNVVVAQRQLRRCQQDVVQRVLDDCVNGVS